MVEFHSLYYSDVHHLMKGSNSLDWYYCYNVCSIQYIKWHNFIFTMLEICSYRQPSKLCNSNITSTSDFVAHRSQVESLYLDHSW